MHRDDIDASLAAKLVAEQFPQWAELPVRPVDLSGWDNRTFRLGDALLVRPGQMHFLRQGDRQRCANPSPGLSTRSVEWLHDHGIATVYQDLAVVSLMEVWRNFFLGSEIRKRQADAFFDVLVSAIRKFAVCLRRKQQHQVRRLFGAFE